MTNQLIRILTVELVERFQVRLGFTDGTEKVVDLEPYLHGPIFEPLRNDPDVFRVVQVNKRMGTVVWPNGADMDPDVLYDGLKPAWMEDEGEEAVASAVA